ncbi:MAG: hypothetical protein D6780_07405 [Candidatus Dadabacteria bacterium]|nr:MAG: hypothetical protein D6780_07405 [Candidatus Dadabacteria bacterium]
MVEVAMELKQAQRIEQTVSNDPGINLSEETLPAQTLDLETAQRQFAEQQYSSTMQDALNAALSVRVEEAQSVVADGYGISFTEQRGASAEEVVRTSTVVIRDSIRANNPDLPEELVDKVALDTQQLVNYHASGAVEEVEVRQYTHNDIDTDPLLEQEQEQELAEELKKPDDLLNYSQDVEHLQEEELLQQQVLEQEMQEEELFQERESSLLEDPAPTKEQDYSLHHTNSHLTSDEEIEGYPSAQNPFERKGVANSLAAGAFYRAFKRIEDEEQEQ